MSPRVDYEKHGRTYARFRQGGPRVAPRVLGAPGGGGPGSGSYEPEDRWVLAVEPSATMRTQRGPTAAPAIDARAEALPFDDDAVDATMACVTIHHWEPPEAGLAEMRRITRGPGVIFSFELDSLPLWQRQYLAEGLEVEQPRFPAMVRIASALGGRVR